MIPDIGLAVRVFANGPGDLGSIPGRVIPKTQKIVLDASLLNTQHYKVRIKGKVEQSREGVAPSPTPCSSYWKGSLRVTLDYGRQLYFLLFYWTLFICRQSNGYRYCNIRPIFQFRHTVKEFQVFLFNTKLNSESLRTHHHHVVPLARISLTLSHHFSLSFIASGRSSGLHPVSSHSCWMYVRAGRPAFARPYVEYITYELVPATSAVSCMSCSSNLDSFRDRRQVAV